MNEMLGRMNTTSPSSARADSITLLNTVLQDRRTLDEAAAGMPIAGDDADARFVMMLSLTTLRHLGQIDALLARYIDKPLPNKRQLARHGLRIGVAQLLLLDTPAHAAVNETVEAVKQGKDSPLSGLVNAVLKRIAKEKPALPPTTANIPDSLRKRWAEWYGHDAVRAMAAVASERPPLDLNLPAPATLAEGERLDDTIWRLPVEHSKLTELPGYAEGSFFVQDIAASYPARLLGDVKGKRVLDLAAAPGGKTMQLARAGAIVTAVDRAPARMALLKENLARMHLQAETVTADMLQWQPAQHFDAILLDAPCSATGTWRKHPEVLQLTTARDITELAALQKQLLGRAWGWLKPGGRLVYCVCSLEREEGEMQAAAFLAAHKNAQLVAASGLPAECITGEGYLRTTPQHLSDKGGMDGFFATCFTKV